MCASLVPPCGFPGHYGPLTRYVILRVAHASGMPGAFFTPPRASDPDMHHGTHVTHVPWCMPGSLTSFEIGGRENVPGIPGACATRNFAYLVRGPYPNPYPITSYGLWDAILDQNITLLHDNETHQMCNMVRVLFLSLICQVSVKYSCDEWCNALYLYAFNPQYPNCYRFARYSGICCSLIRYGILDKWPTRMPYTMYNHIYESLNENWRWN